MGIFIGIALFLASIFHLAAYVYKRRRLNRLISQLKEIKDEMDKYGVTTLEELEAIKEKEQLYDIFELSDNTLKEDKESDKRLH